jgi:hypothetical protein
MADDPPPRPKPRTMRWVVVGVLVVLLLPAVVAFVLVPLLLEQPFESAEEIDPAAVKQLRVFVLNRKELDGGRDVGPYLAAAEDYPALLAPLREAHEVTSFPDARGPWLAEYRVLLTSGRKGTIRLYWSRPQGGWAGAPAFAAAGGGAAVTAAAEARQVPPVTLRFQIGPRKYEGGSATGLIRAAEAAAERGTRTK